VNDTPAADLTAHEVAAIFSAHEKTVRRWATQGRIPHYRTPSGLLRFRREDIEQLRETITPKAAS